MDIDVTERLLEVVDWRKNFENNRSKSVEKARWVPVPNKHDGLKFSRMMAHRDGATLFSAWILIVQVASKCPRRGLLTAGDGAAMSVDDLAFITRAPRRWFEMAIPYLLEIGWLRFYSGNSDTQPTPDCQSTDTRPTPDCQSTDTRPTPDCHPTVSQPTPDCQSTDTRLSPSCHPRGRAQNGMEWNGMEVPPTAPQGGQDGALSQQPVEPPAETAKKRVCRIFGRDAARPIPFEAMAELGRLCPIPEEEFELIEWFYSLPADEDEPELKWRRNDFSKLVLHWTEDVDRARAYREKNGGAKKGAQKKEEPAGWRERALALWPTAEMPGSFFDLSPDVQRELQQQPNQTQE